MSEPAESTDAAATTGGAVEQSESGQASPQVGVDEAKPKENGTHGEPPKPAKPKYRHDWYQTPTDVYINVMIKGLKDEDVSVNFEEKMVNFISLPPPPPTLVSQASPS